MPTLFVDQLAQWIRVRDGGNKLYPYELGYEVAHLLSVRPYRRDSAEVIQFVQHANPDKRMGGGRTADDRGETGWKSTQDYAVIDKSDPYPMDPYGRIRGGW